MILMISINFSSFHAGSISCFKTVQAISIMLFFFWLLRDLTARATAIKVHYMQSMVLKHRMYGDCH